MSKTIDDCLLLSHEDKQIFKHALSISDVDYLQNMSIFSKEGIYEKHGNYYVFKTNPSINIYYLGYNNNSIFIDENKKILFYSRYYFDLFNEFINYIDHILNLIHNININENILDIGSNFVSIEKWFVTYGHFKDEIFVITDYIDNNNKNHKALLDYHTTDLPNYKANINYKIIDNILLGDNSINSYEHINKILRLKDLILIRHRITDTTFHSFPINVRNKIINSINNNNNMINHDKIFITRGYASHLTRNLSNQMEVENYLHNHNFTLVNPELLNYGEFINTIKNTDKIVITWGGALVNLIYLKPYTKVYILKSQSYEHESLDLFEKIIKTYDLHVEVITHENNIITLNKLNYLIK